MATEVRPGPNLNQKSRLFDPPKAKTPTAKTVTSTATTKPAAAKKELSATPTATAASTSPKADVKASSGPNLNQKSRLFDSSKPATAISAKPATAISAKPAPAPSPKSTSATAAKTTTSRGSASTVKSVPKVEDTTSKEPVKRVAGFSRIVICYCCGQGFSIHSVNKHYDKCRERRPANYKCLPKEATCPEMPRPNTLPLPGETSTAAEFQAFNDESFQIYKAHLVQCPWGCGRTTEPDRTAVHMRGCSLRPKPPPKAEGEEDTETKQNEDDEQNDATRESANENLTQDAHKEAETVEDDPAANIEGEQADVNETEQPDHVDETVDPVASGIESEEKQTEEPMERETEQTEETDEQALPTEGEPSTQPSETAAEEPNR